MKHFPSAIKEETKFKIYAPQAKSQEILY